MAFGSGAVKDLNKLDGRQYSPGPGFYNQIKNKSSFAREYMKSDQDKDSYYLIQNGTLLRKLQQFSANRQIDQRPNITGLTQDVPGPGQYSPRQYQLTADTALNSNRTLDAKKFISEQVTPAPLGTMRSFQDSFTKDSIDAKNITKTSNLLKDLIQSRVEMQNKKILGKNPPPKLPLNRPKAVASIPSNTVAPPEDKTMTMTSF